VRRKGALCERRFVFVFVRLGCDTQQMHGQRLRHGKRKKVEQILPRDLDRYPKSVRVDFRGFDVSFGKGWKGGSCW